MGAVVSLHDVSAALLRIRLRSFALSGRFRSTVNNFNRHSCKCSGVVVAATSAPTNGAISLAESTPGNAQQSEIVVVAGRCIAITSYIFNDLCALVTAMKVAMVQECVSRNLCDRKLRNPFPSFSSRNVQLTTYRTGYLSLKEVGRLVNMFFVVVPTCAQVLEKNRLTQTSSRVNSPFRLG